MSSETDDTQVFVFPLPKVTLFPSTSQPLNIFEPRYIEMVKDALKLNQRIALGQSASVHSILGCGRPQLLQERADGTLMILLRADCKVRLTSIDDGSKPYILARAQTVPERSELQTGHVFYLHRLMKEMSGWLERNIPHPKRRTEFMEQLLTDEERVNTGCTVLIEDPAWRQKLLELDDLSKRLETAASLFETSAASH